MIAIGYIKKHNLVIPCYLGCLAHMLPGPDAVVNKLFSISFVKKINEWRITEAVSVLKNFAKYSGKKLCQSLFFNGKMEKVHSLNQISQLSTKPAKIDYLKDNYMFLLETELRIT